MFIIAMSLFIVLTITGVLMCNECTRERINVDRMRYVTLAANERQIAQKFDARLMPRRDTRRYMHD